MSSNPLPHAEFLELLRDSDLQAEYEKEVRKVKASARRGFRKKVDELVEREKAGLADDDEHRRVLNACIYPFAIGLVSGYYFVTAAPLSELVPRVANLDFLVMCPVPPTGEVPVAIVGEAKGPINDPDRVVMELKSRISAFESKWDYARDTYLKGAGMQREFVLGVPAIDANETSKSIIRKGGSIIVWAADFFNDPILALHRPDLSRGDESVRKTMFHHNATLNRGLDKVLTSQTFKTFYQQSHPVAKLRILTAVDRGKLDSTFSLDDVKALVQEALDYIPDENMIERETTSILDLAIRIGFVESPHAGRYKIKSRSKNAASRETEIEKLWIKHRLGRMLRKEIDDKIASVQPRYEERRKTRPALEEF